MFNHTPTKYTEVIKERRVKYKRHYETPKGKLYRSVTTITSILSKKAIAEWRDGVGEAKADYITITAAIIGTELHKINEDYLNNIDIEDLDKKYTNIIPKAHFYNMRSVLDKIDNIHTLEAGVYSDEFKLAGRVDCIAEYDGELSIIDFKTSKKEKPEDWILGYFVQATAYAQAWKERTGEDVKNIVILMSGLDGSVTVYKKKVEDYIEELKKTIILYEEDLEKNG